MDDAYALLRLQMEWGADEALDAVPLDRLRAASPPSAPPRPSPAARPGTSSGAIRTLASSAGGPATARGMPAERAREAAGQASTLDALRAAIAGFDGCALRDTASHLVWAEGAPDSPVLIIGEAPGREEDRTGHPFAGADGALLEQMLGSVGLDRTHLMLAPLLPWRPPGERPPNAGELATCLPFLHRLIALQRPGYLLLFGGGPAKALLAVSPRRRQAPNWIDCRIPELQKTIPSLALPRLADQLKEPAVRRFAWAGLRLLRRALDAI